MPLFELRRLLEYPLARLRSLPPNARYLFNIGSSEQSILPKVRLSRRYHALSSVNILVSIMEISNLSPALNGNSLSSASPFGRYIQYFWYVLTPLRVFCLLTLRTNVPIALWVTVGSPTSSCLSNN